jgi:hypothetical protein
VFDRVTPVQLEHCEINDVVFDALRPIFISGPPPIPTIRK